MSQKPIQNLQILRFCAVLIVGLGVFYISLFGDKVSSVTAQGYLQLAEDYDATPTPTPTPTPITTPSPTGTPTPTPTATASPSPTASPTPSITPSPTPTPTLCSIGEWPGDANLDCCTDALDFAIWDANKFGPGTWTEGDFTGDNTVDGPDFIIWNNNKFTCKPGTCTIGTQPGDADLDCCVDTDDQDIVAANFGGAGGWEQGDFDSDTIVDSDDLNILFANFGNCDGASPTPTPTPIGVCGPGHQPGDASLDCCVTQADQNILAANFGGPGSWTEGDFSGDGQVDGDDFSILATNFGNCTPPTPTPTPTPAGCAIGEWPGDANLDCCTDSLDFDIWNTNKFGPGTWTEGDFTGDNTVDGADFIIWNNNKFTCKPGTTPTPTPTPTSGCAIGEYPGDANLDCCTDATDFTIWDANKFGPGTWTEGDFDGDNTVDGLDYIIWNNNKFTCKPGVTPTPTPTTTPTPAPTPTPDPCSPDNTAPAVSCGFTLDPQKDGTSNLVLNFNGTDGCSMAAWSGNFSCVFTATPAVSGDLTPGSSCSGDPCTGSGVLVTGISGGIVCPTNEFTMIDSAGNSTTVSCSVP